MNGIRGLLVLSSLLAACGSTPPETLGLKDGRFSPCPASPNCVSSFAAEGDKTHYIGPFAYTGTREAARTRLMKVLSVYSPSAVSVIRSDADYIRLEFRTALWRFTDDVEFYFPPDQGIIHVRSASRIGYGDFGANRKRVERLRAEFGQ
jgi:uncharacterized protein (DUF1499 family)